MGSRAARERLAPCPLGLPVRWDAGLYGAEEGVFLLGRTASRGQAGPLQRTRPTRPTLGVRRAFIAFGVARVFFTGGLLVFSVLFSKQNGHQVLLPLPQGRYQACLRKAASVVAVPPPSKPETPPTLHGLLGTPTAETAGPGPWG